MLKQRIHRIPESIHFPFSVQIHHQLMPGSVFKRRRILFRIKVKRKDHQMDVDSFLLQLRNKIVPAIQIFRIDCHILRGSLAEPSVEKGVNTKEPVSLSSGSLCETLYSFFERLVIFCLENIFHTIEPQQTNRFGVFLFEDKFALVRYCQPARFPCRPVHLSRQIQGAA